VNPTEPLTIPTTIEAATPTWLTRALRTQLEGLNAQVQETSVQRIGEGVGLMGELARLRLDWRPHEPQLPESVILKLPASDPDTRASGQILGLYEREARFYLELAGELPIRTPRCFHAAAELDPKAPEDPEVLERALARLPVWLIRWLLRLAEWQARRSPRAAVLLLEDLGQLRGGDQLDGGNRSDWERAIDALARLHAAGWQREQWLGHIWVARLRANVRLNHALFSRQYRQLPPLWDGRLLGCGRRLGAWLAQNGLALMESLTSAPETLCHSDYRLDNLFFDDASGDVIMLDWQLVSRGPGVLDLAYFLSGVLGRDISQSTETTLVERYHAGLLASGVSGYEWPACLADYRRAQLATWQRCIAAASAVEPGDARGGAMLESWWDRASGRLDDVDPDAVLAATHASA
jgi:hypothetical protein